MPGATMFAVFSQHSIRTPRGAQFLPGVVLIVLALCGMAWSAADAGGEAIERPGTASVLHVRVASELDSVAMVRELRAYLSPPEIESHDGVLLELEPGRMRADLAWELGTLLTSATRPVWVFIDGRGSPAAGPEQLELGILARGAWVDPGVSFRWDGPGIHADLMPESLDASRMSRERYSSLWVALERRGASTRLAEGLLRPADAVRATRVVAGECALVESPVEPGEAAGLLTLVEPLPDGGTRGRISSDVAAALRLIDGRERSTREVLRRALGEDASRGIQTRRVVVESRLDEVIQEAHGLMRTARAEAALAEDVLRRRIESGLGRGAYERAVRERARRSLVVVERGEGALGSFEALAAEHPEVLRTRAPVQADLPGVEETAARAWAREIEYVRRGLARIRADAMAQAEGSP